jgi:hypothetical protein
LTLLALHRCHRPSAPSLAQASPPRGPSLQSLRLALHACNRPIKPSLVLIFSTLITWLNVMSYVHLSSFIITCVSFTTSPSHFHLHGICCSYTCTCGLITCVSHINTISPPRLSLNYQNQQGPFTRSLKPGDSVLRLIQKKDGRHKLLSPWEGPFIVKTATRPSTYKLMTPDEIPVKNTWHISQLKRFYN